MHQASSELSHYPEYDYLVFNDNFDEALAQLRAIFVANRLKNARVTRDSEEKLRALLA
jgi:guanylate kinase